MMKSNEQIALDVIQSWEFGGWRNSTQRNASLQVYIINELNHKTNEIAHLKERIKQLESKSGS